MLLIVTSPLVNAFSSPGLVEAEGGVYWGCSHCLISRPLRSLCEFNPLTGSQTATWVWAEDWMCRVSRTGAVDVELLRHTLQVQEHACKYKHAHRVRDAVAVAFFVRGCTCYSCLYVHALVVRASTRLYTPHGFLGCKLTRQLSPMFKASPNILRLMALGSRRYWNSACWAEDRTRAWRR